MILVAYSLGAWYYEARTRGRASFEYKFKLRSHVSVYVKESDGSVDIIIEYRIHVRLYPPLILSFCRKRR